MILKADVTVLVDYDKSPKELVDAGEYERIHLDLNADYCQRPKNKSGKKNTEIALIEPQIPGVYERKKTSSSEWVKWLADLGYRPVDFFELLAVGATFTDTEDFCFRQVASANLKNFIAIWHYETGSGPFRNLAAYDELFPSNLRCWLLAAVKIG